MGIVRCVTADGGDIDHAVAEFDEGTPMDVYQVLTLVSETPTTCRENIASMSLRWGIIPLYWNVQVRNIV